MNPSGQPRRVAVKRKMPCCVTTAHKQRKNKTVPKIPCQLCQCKFYQVRMLDKHMLDHQCKRCDRNCVALDDDGLPHSFRYQQEAQLEKLKIQRQQKMDDDFVLSYIKANRLHEYRPQLDYDPDVEYIVHTYRFEKEEWVPFIKKFKRQILPIIFDVFNSSWNYSRNLHLTEQLNAQTIAYLLEHGALTVRDATDFLKIVSKNRKYDDYVNAIVSYLLDKDYEFKAEWVAKAIYIDELIERIKTKHTFTFGEIHKARAWQSYSPLDVKALRTFYTQLQKHFFNPSFENPFDGGLEDDDELDAGQPQRFIYNKEEDKLVMTNGEGMYGETHSFGICASIMEKSLEDVLKEYMEAIKVYKKLDAEFDDMYEKKRDEDYWYDRQYDRRRWSEEDEDEDDDGDHDHGGYDDYVSDEYYDSDEIEEKESERNEQEREVSKLYFVISMK